MKQKVYTSLNLPVNLKNKLKQCAQKLDVDMSQLLSVLCYKAGRFVCAKTHCFQTVDYQDKGANYEILPVYFYSSDHEYMHANRLSCKVSVSKLLACAMFMFLEEIMEKGINQLDIAHLQVKKNSYKKKSYFIRNFILTINNNDQFEEYKMKMRISKRKKT